ncbi:RNA polymerase II-associated [Suillus discolor]|uniref:RNA polymerase II-associated n=1 Tax=Suillus discolor TaxID=1912936 RepID=A0A9P7F8A4_9AGAM|nr:RNA polymerase II-associated [Suillus discolor]KAG2110388.1 RNA polymerase II-associated [Suillus discolor]
MSLRKSKLDLLVRVRYSNPLPAPPCPPKLVDIPTNPLRYAQPTFINVVTNDTPLPMIVDAECGMPLDLGRWEYLWEENGNDDTLNPDPDNLPSLDPKDRLLLGDPSTYATPYTIPTTSGTSTPLPPHVPWLRKTEYLSREGVQRTSSSHESKQLLQPINVSHEAQLQTIEAGFAASTSLDLSTLSHPNKTGVTAIQSYDVLPDADIWANAYDLFRFNERPGERPIDTEDPRLDCAILRPMESDGDHFLAYYLTKEDADALEFKEERFALKSSEENRTTAFHFVRDYETVKIEQEVPNEFLLVLDNGDAGERGPGAYYKNIERKMTLKKKRMNQNDTYADKWQVVHISHVAMSSDELEERNEALAEVVDPLYLFSRDAEGEVDADGEVDIGGIEIGTEGDAEGDGGIMAEIF